MTNTPEYRNLYNPKLISGADTRLFLTCLEDMNLQGWAAACFVFDALSNSVYSDSIENVGARLSPLYASDPHDVQKPYLPFPACLPLRDSGIDNPLVLQSAAVFCLGEHREVSAELQRPLVQPIHYLDVNVNNRAAQLSLTWDNSGTCVQSHIAISPSQNAGVICKDIFQRIVQECKS